VFVYQLFTSSSTIILFGITTQSLRSNDGVIKSAESEILLSFIPLEKCHPRTDFAAFAFAECNEINTDE